MYRFINNAGMAAYMSEAKLRTVKKDLYVGAARRNIDGMAIADPMMVCGRVNRHSTTGKGGVPDFSSASGDELSPPFTLMSAGTLPSPLATRKGVVADFSSALGDELPPFKLISKGALTSPSEPMDKAAR